MLEITKTKNAHDYDVITIKTEDEEFEISFQNNLDLYWRYICKKSILDEEKTKKFRITKENYFIYNLFDELYNNVKNKKICFNSKLLFNSCEKYLFKNNVIDWHSDDFIYENASRVIIKPVEDEYEIIFVKSKKEYDDGMFMTFSVRFSNRGSRYEPYNIFFMYMYNKLKEYDPNNHQIHLEEYLYNQKTLKKTL